MQDLEDWPWTLIHGGKLLRKPKLFVKRLLLHLGVCFKGSTRETSINCLQNHLNLACTREDED